jgi:hypothetical protein
MAAVAPSLSFDPRGIINVGSGRSIYRYARVATTDYDATAEKQALVDELTWTLSVRVGDERNVRITSNEQPVVASNESKTVDNLRLTGDNIEINFKKAVIALRSNVLTVTAIR